MTLAKWLLQQVPKLDTSMTSGNFKPGVAGMRNVLSFEAGQTAAEKSPILELASSCPTHGRRGCRHTDDLHALEGQRAARSEAVRVVCAHGEGRGVAPRPRQGRGGIAEESSLQGKQYQQAHFSLFGGRLLDGCCWIQVSLCPISASKADLAHRFAGFASPGSVF